MSVARCISSLAWPRVAFCVCIVVCGQCAAADDDRPISFQVQVLPVLKRNCLKCHGVSKKEGKLQLHSAVRIWKGGESGPTVVPSNPEQSLLWTRVSKDEMPPEHPLTDPEKQILRDWIAQGAPGLPTDDVDAESMSQDEHWAFTRLHAAEPPQVDLPESCRTPVDQFFFRQIAVLESLQDHVETFFDILAHHSFVAHFDLIATFLHQFQRKLHYWSKLLQFDQAGKVLLHCFVGFES